MLIWLLMAGEGQRFKKAGYTTPKLLLPLQGKALFEHALDGLRQLTGSYHISLNTSLGFQPEVISRLPKGCWHLVLNSTPGPLQTLLEGEGCLTNDESLLICDADAWLHPQELAKAIQVFETTSCDGGVLLRQTTDPECSYAMVQPDWTITETREKDVFSRWSTTGPYWFRSAKQCLLAAQTAAAAHVTSISPIYNYLPGRTLGIPVSSFYHAGTPEAYEWVKESVSQWVTGPK